VTSLAIGQESELAEALPAARQHMQQEAANELIGRKGHSSLLIAAGVVFPAKGDLAIFASEQAVVGNGYSMSVATQISQNLGWATEGRLGIDPPLTASQAQEQALESGWLGQIGAGAMKGEFAMLESLGQGFQEESAEQPRQHVNRKKEAFATTNPALVIG